MASVNGGYDYEFIDLPDEYNCPICLCVLRNPVQVECGHRFCSACFSDMAVDSLDHIECPLDRNKVLRSKVFPDAAVQRFILNSKVKCPNCVHGCDWIGELNALQNHEGNCGYPKKVGEELDPVKEIEKLRIDNINLSNEIKMLRSEHAAQQKTMIFIQSKLESDIRDLTKQLNNFIEICDQKAIAEAIAKASSDSVDSVTAIAPRYEWKCPAFMDHNDDEEHFSPLLYHRQYCFQLSLEKDHGGGRNLCFTLPVSG